MRLASNAQQARCSINGALSMQRVSRQRPHDQLGICALIRPAIARSVDDDSSVLLIAAINESRVTGAGSCHAMLHKLQSGLAIRATQWTFKKKARLRFATARPHELKLASCAKMLLAAWHGKAIVFTSKDRARSAGPRPLIPATFRHGCSATYRRGAARPISFLVDLRKGVANAKHHRCLA